MLGTAGFTAGVSAGAKAGDIVVTAGVTAAAQRRTWQDLVECRGVVVAVHDSCKGAGAKVLNHVEHSTCLSGPAGHHTARHTHTGRIGQNTGATGINLTGHVQCCRADRMLV